MIRSPSWCHDIHIEFRGSTVEVLVVAVQCFRKRLIGIPAGPAYFGGADCVHPPTTPRLHHPRSPRATTTTTQLLEKDGSRLRCVARNRGCSSGTNGEIWLLTGPGDRL